MARRSARLATAAPPRRGRSANKHAAGSSNPVDPTPKNKPSKKRSLKSKVGRLEDGLLECIRVDNQPPPQVAPIEHEDDSGDEMLDSITVANPIHFLSIPSDSKGKKTSSNGATAGDNKKVMDTARANDAAAEAFGPTDQDIEMVDVDENLSIISAHMRDESNTESIEYQMVEISSSSHGNDYFSKPMSPSYLYTLNTGGSSNLHHHPVTVDTGLSQTMLHNWAHGAVDNSAVDQMDTRQEFNIENNLSTAVYYPDADISGGVSNPISNHLNINEINDQQFLEYLSTCPDAMLEDFTVENNVSIIKHYIARDVSREAFDTTLRDSNMNEDSEDVFSKYLSTLPAGTLIDANGFLTIHLEPTFTVNVEITPQIPVRDDFPQELTPKTTIPAVNPPAAISHDPTILQDSQDIDLYNFDFTALPESGSNFDHDTFTYENSPSLGLATSHVAELNSILSKSSYGYNILPVPDENAATGNDNCDNLFLLHPSMATNTTTTPRVHNAATNRRTRTAKASKALADQREQNALVQSVVVEGTAVSTKDPATETPAMMDGIYQSSDLMDTNTDDPSVNATIISDSNAAQPPQSTASTAISTRSQITNTVDPNCAITTSKSTLATTTNAKKGKKADKPPDWYSKASRADRSRIYAEKKASRKLEEERLQDFVAAQIATKQAATIANLELEASRAFPTFLQGPQIVFDDHNRRMGHILVKQSTLHLMPRTLISEFEDGIKLQRRINPGTVKEPISVMREQGLICKFPYGVEFPPYTCDICDRVFNTARGLIEHHQTRQHRNVRRSCYICNYKTFTSIPKFHKHNSEVHPHLNPCTCSCGKAFSEPRGLDEHHEGSPACAWRAEADDKNKDLVKDVLEEELSGMAEVESDNGEEELEDPRAKDGVWKKGGNMFRY